jgi:membrane associated rhomboid family serine protease
MVLPVPGHAKKTRRFPRAVAALCALCVAVFFLELRAPHPDAFIRAWGLTPATLPRSWAGVLTYGFLHGGWAHLLGNLWFFWVFGARLEERVGWRRMVGLFGVCSVAAGLVHAASTPDSAVPLVGASGAISGVMGALWWVEPAGAMGAWLLVTVHVRVWVFVALWGGWQVVQAFAGLEQAHGAGSAGVAFFAHVGGLFAGLCVAAVTVGRPARGSDGGGGRRGSRGRGGRKARA